MGFVLWKDLLTRSCDRQCSSVKYDASFLRTIPCIFYSYIGTAVKTQFLFLHDCADHEAMRVRPFSCAY